MRMLSQMYLFTKKSLLNFGSYPSPDSDKIRLDIKEFSSVWYSSNKLKEFILK